jgi:hypothetical protein
MRRPSVSTILTVLGVVAALLSLVFGASQWLADIDRRVFWWWAEGLSKLMLFLSFWFMASEVVGAAKLRKFVQGGRLLICLGILVSVFLITFFPTFRSVRKSLADEKKMEVQPKSDRAPIRSIPEYITADPPPVESQNQLKPIVDWIDGRISKIANWLVDDPWLLPIACGSAVGVFWSVFYSGLFVGLTQVLFFGTKSKEMNEPWSEEEEKRWSQRKFFVGGILFGIGGLLDIAVWMFKPN